MAHQSNFQRSSPLRIPVRLGKLKPSQPKLKKANEVPPLATQLLRSLNNGRRNSLGTRITIGRTVRQEVNFLDRSCMDQFDDSFALEADAVQSLTPRKSPHLRRRGSLTHLNKVLKPSSVMGSGFSSALGLPGAVSRKKISSMRKRMMNTMRKVMPMGRRTGYSQM